MLSRLFGKPTVGRESTTRPRSRPSVEQLEGRLTPAWAGIPPTVVDPAGALAVTLNGQGDASGNGVNLRGEVDYLTLVAPTTGSYTISASASGWSRMDTVVGLFDSRGQRLAFNDDISTSNTNSQLAATLTAGTRYYVGITRYTRSRGGDFTWSIDGPVASTPTSRVDLVGVALTGTASAKWGQAVTFRGQVRNVGTAAAGGFHVQWYLSRDAVGSADDIPLKLTTGAATRGIAGLAPNALGTFDVALQLPVTIPAGWAGSTFHIVMRSDSAGQVAESNESNNFGKAGAGRDSRVISITSTTTPPPTPGRYDIQLVVTGVTASQAALFERAAARWEQVIVGALPAAVYRGQTVQGLLVHASVAGIDGVGGTLGEAGPDAFRSGSNLPYHGTMSFDSADIASMERDGSLLGVIQHEIGHILGIGTIWDTKGLLAGARTANPRFLGAQATAAYNQIFGRNESGVPVENTGGGGTRDSHWRDSILGNELMTGWVGPGVNLPMSRITVASLADLGYTVNLAAADAYTAPAGAAALASAVGSSSAPRVLLASITSAISTSTSSAVAPTPEWTPGTVGMRSISLSALYFAVTHDDDRSDPLSPF